MQIYGKTDIGRVRSSNQDSFYTAILPDGKAFAIVCDGMGGANAGNVASKKAVEFIKNYIERSYNSSFSSEKIADLLKNAVLSANSELYAISLKDKNLEGMGTTVVLTIVSEDSAIICHVGDSRAYIFNNEILQITRDHSMVQNLIESGKLTLEEAKTYPEKNVITRALGVEGKVISDINIVPFASGNKILLCTDGLTNFIDVSDIKDILKNSELASVPDILINKANQNGGGDNITAVVICTEKG